MTTTIAVDAEAEAELIAAGDWYYANARAGVAIRFREAIERSLDEVSGAPEAFPVVDTWRGVALRRVFVRGFPYQIVYSDISGQLRVLAVAHLHRRPGYWRARLTSP